MSQVEKLSSYSYSLDLNSVVYSVWGALQQMVYGYKISDIDHLKCMLMYC